MTDQELGRRVGYWRRRRNLTQAVFADRVGRSKSWVEKVERGERSAGRLSVLDEICEVLQIDLPALIGEEPHRRSQECLDDSEVGRIRSALERYDFASPDGNVPDLALLRPRLAHAWAAFEFADYQVMGSLLPGLLEDAQRASEALGSPESKVLLAEVYQVIASTLRKLGEHTLALNLSLADQLEQGSGTERLRALYGHVLLQAAMAAAASGDDRRAALMVDTARACGQAGNRDEALRRLLAAEHIAAPEVRCRPVAQATIEDLLHRSRGGPAPELARLAERAGVSP